MTHLENDAGIVQTELEHSANEQAAVSSDETFTNNPMEINDVEQPDLAADTAVDVKTEDALKHEEIKVEQQDEEHIEIKTEPAPNVEVPVENERMSTYSHCSHLISRDLNDELVTVTWDRLDCR